MAGQIDYSCDDILPACKLPGDLMVSILSILPVKSLLKFKAVSKPWCSLISSPSFMKTHRRRQSSILLLWLLDPLVKSVYGLANHSYVKNHTADCDILILESPPITPDGEIPFMIINSCNGLVCLYSLWFSDGSDGLILWNPSTRKYKSLELPISGHGVSFITIGMCYIEATSDFKILGWIETYNSVNKPPLFVYSLNSDSWEKLDYADKKPLPKFCCTTFMNGCMHWMTYACTCSYVCTCNSEDVIVAFDVTDGTMSCFGVPNNCSCRRHSSTSMQSLIIGGCLSIVIFPDPEVMENVFEVWVMLEYGVEGSWVKRLTIPGLEKVTKPLISWNDVEIVFTRMNENEGSILTFCDPFSKKQYCLKFNSFYIKQVFNHVESLVPVEMK